MTRLGSVPCEGSGHPPSVRLDTGLGICKMCGSALPCEGDRLVEHDRLDILGLFD